LAFRRLSDSAPVRDPKGRLIEIEGMLVDVTERKAAEEKIAPLARSDALTGLANRATFVERLRLAFAAARRGAPAFAVLYLDLDHFKNINDSFGHPFGDVLLQAVADRLKSSTRGTDLVARPGGDEFAILQTDLSDSADAGALAVKIRAALALPLRLEGRDLHVTASVGIAMPTPEITAPEDMLARADLALYRAKDEGRDQYRFHSEELDEQVRLEVSTAEELKEALARDQFELCFQPQVELSSGRIVGMEPLLRWNHPTRGQIHPLAFLAITEKVGAMTAIRTWVLDHACRQMNAWRRAGIAPPTIAVNVSLSQLKNANEFVQLFESTLAKWGVPGSNLELDVTESMLAHTTLAQNDVLERLQKLGIKIAIDDFGTKFSSLDYLRTYRVSRLKIPKSMVDAATLHPGNAAMVRAITSIARELNVEVVAQGVETEAQWSFLTAPTPSTNVQGYFYSMPVPAERAAEPLHDGVIKPTAGLTPAPG
jgi:diguanylate cyclase (GGDEF)-like protein